MDADVAQAPFRIGLWHHNLRSYDGISIQDADAACQVFKKSSPGIELALHGHVHQGDSDFYHPPKRLPALAYSCVGSFGVRAEDRPGDSLHGRVLMSSQ